MLLLALAVPMIMTGTAFAGDGTAGTAAAFEAQALANLPLHTAKAYNAANPDPNGPGAGEIWIRIKADHSREATTISQQAADLYRSVSNTGNPVTVLLWVGNRVVGKAEY
jgi:hypothetical protein